MSRVSRHFPVVSKLASVAAHARVQLAEIWSRVLMDIGGRLAAIATAMAMAARNAVAAVADHALVVVPAHIPTSLLPVRAEEMSLAPRGRTPSPAVAAGAEHGRLASIRLSRKVAMDLLMGLEMALIAIAAIAVEHVLRFRPLDTDTYLPLATAGLLVGIGTTRIMAARGLYDHSDMHHVPQSTWQIILALGLSISAFTYLALLFGLATPTLASWLATWAGVTLVLLLSARSVAAMILGRMCRVGLFDVRVALVGVGQLSEKIAIALKGNATGLSFHGAYDDRGPERTGVFANSSRVGTISDLVAECRAGHVDRVIIALPPTAFERITILTAVLGRLPVTLDIATYVSRRARVAGIPSGDFLFDTVGLVPIRKAPLADWGRVLKTGLDYALTLLLLPVVLPLMGAIALAIKLDSPGPCIFKQSRRGFNQRLFRIWKFRTMSVTEDGGTIRQATRGDSRVTRVGAVLRRTSLDELPQLVNVLLGEMSLVGPRPHALAHDQQWEEELFHYAGRHQVKPGITGWAQVHGLRGEIDCPEKLQARVNHDLDYIQYWSIWLDIKILAMTPITGFINRNAY